VSEFQAKTDTDMFLTEEDFKTTLYDEIIDAISREDPTVLQACIDSAISQAKSYLHDYDTAAIFSAVKADRHPLLLTFVKDIAVWHFLAPGNPCSDLKFREHRYDSAISWLRGVQKRDIAPDLPPAPASDPTVGTIRLGSNWQRENHF
jgi:hypothetical protein